MPSGYRGLAFTTLVAALVLAFGLGLYVSGMNYPDEGYQPYQARQQDKDGAVAPVTNVSATIVERTPCDQPQSETESDLCAQWRAAQAAEKSADWTVYGFWATLVGIALLTWQLVLTREAVTDTGIATKAMNRQNELAEDTAKRQLRAYIGLLNGSLVDSTGAVEASLTFKNFGATPAYNLVLAGQLVRRPLGHQIAIGPPAETVTPVDLAPSQEFEFRLPDDEPDEIGGIKPPVANTHFVVISGHFDDVFGDRHNIKICLAKFGDAQLAPYPYE